MVGCVSFVLWLIVCKFSIAWCCRACKSYLHYIKKLLKLQDDYGFTNKISSKGHDSRNSELNRSESLTKKNTLKYIGSFVFY